MQTNVFRCENDCRHALKGISLLKLNRAQKSCMRWSHCNSFRETRKFLTRHARHRSPLTKHTEIKQTLLFLFQAWSSESPARRLKRSCTIRLNHFNDIHIAKALKMLHDRQDGASSELTHRAFAVRLLATLSFSSCLTSLTDSKVATVGLTGFFIPDFLMQPGGKGGGGTGEIALNLTSLSSLLFFFFFFWG